MSSCWTPCWPLLSPLSSHLQRTAPRQTPLPLPLVRHLSSSDSRKSTDYLGQVSTCWLRCDKDPRSTASPPPPLFFWAPHHFTRLPLRSFFSFLRHGNEVELQGWVAIGSAKRHLIQTDVSLPRVSSLSCSECGPPSDHQLTPCVSSPRAGTCFSYWRKTWDAPGMPGVS